MTSFHEFLHPWASSEQEDCGGGLLPFSSGSSKPAVHSKPSGRQGDVLVSDKQRSSYNKSMLKTTFKLLKPEASSIKMKQYGSKIHCCFAALSRLLPDLLRLESCSSPRLPFWDQQCL